MYGVGPSSVFPCPVLGNGSDVYRLLVANTLKLVSSFLHVVVVSPIDPLQLWKGL
jgi:hypothetical protein